MKLIHFLFRVSAASLLLFFIYFFIISETWQTKVVCAGSVILLMALAARLKRSLFLKLLVLSLLLLFLPSASLLLTSPLNSSQVIEIPGKTWTWLRSFSPAAFIPEVDQFILGARLLPGIDPLLTEDQAENLENFLRLEYHKIRDSEFGKLQSSMPDAYADIFLWRDKSLHAYAYRPRSLAKEKPPILFFFHGSMGNFVVYTWVLSELAERLGAILISPSGGIGMWPTELTQEVFEKSLNNLEKISPFDREQIHVLGLSNGGRALSRLLELSSKDKTTKVKTFTFISPVINSKPEHTAFQLKPEILIIGGDSDNRIPWHVVLEAGKQIEDLGYSVQYKRHVGGDHFILFSKKDVLITEIENFIR